MIIPNLDFGGAQRSFCSLANTLNNQYQVSVVVFNTELGISFDFDTKIYDLNIPGGKNYFSKSFYFLRRWLAVKRLKKHLDIDTTISYLEGANYINALTGTDKKILSVRGSKYHDQNIRGAIGWLRKKILIPIIYKRAEHIVALNHGIERELVQQLGIAKHKVLVIRNFYDLNRIRKLAGQPMDGSLGFLEKIPYIIYAGRIAQGKGITTIVDTFHILKQEHHNLKLLLVGDGPLMNDLINYSKRKGLNVSHQLSIEDASISDSDTLFLGYQDNPYKFIRGAKILLIASEAEGGPNILMESLMCETLVVSTDCPYGPREYLAPNLKDSITTKPKEVQNGILLPQPGYNGAGITQWCQFISTYLKDNDRRKKVVERSSKWVSTQSSVSIIEKWKKII